MFHVAPPQSFALQGGVDYDVPVGEKKNSPWSHLLHGAHQLSEISSLLTSIDPKFIASAHGPPSKGRTEQMVGLVAQGVAAPPFKGPTQKDLEAMMAGGPPK